MVAGAFVDNDELDRRLLAEAAADRVVMLPTADAFEEPAPRRHVDDVGRATRRRDRGADGAATPRCRRRGGGRRRRRGDGRVPRRRLVDAPAQRAQGHRGVRRPAAVSSSAAVWSWRSGRPRRRSATRCSTCAAAASRSDSAGDRRGDHPGERDVERARRSRGARSLATTPLIELPTGSAAIRRATAGNCSATPSPTASSLSRRVRRSNESSVSLASKALPTSSLRPKSSEVRSPSVPRWCRLTRVASAGAVESTMAAAGAVDAGVVVVIVVVAAGDDREQHGDQQHGGDTGADEHGPPSHRASFRSCFANSSWRSWRLAF